MQSVLLHACQQSCHLRSPSCSQRWSVDPPSAVRHLQCLYSVHDTLHVCTQVEGVRIYHDQALNKEPGGGYTPWHCDGYYWPVQSDKIVTAWVPLQVASPPTLLAFCATTATGKPRSASQDHAFCIQPGCDCVIYVMNYYFDCDRHGCDPAQTFCAGCSRRDGTVAVCCRQPLTRPWQVTPQACLS